MFNSGNPTGLIFSGAATTNTNFGQGSNIQSGFFGSTNQSSGTTCPYQPVDSTDSIQKNNQNVNINTKLHCLTAMKAYESKSVEELRSEDYQANRLTKTVNTIFSGQQNTGVMNSPSTMFTSFSTNQQSSNSLFSNTNQQTNSFGNKTLFSGNTTPQNNAFGAFNQAKPNSLFSTTNSGNKALFPVSQTPQTGSIFGSNPVSSTTSIFGTQQQPAQSSSIFGTPQPAVNTNSFGFQPQNNLFGNTSKAFGSTGVFTSTSSSSSVFGNSASTTPGLFGQPAQTAGFGTATKPLFPGNTGTSIFGQTASTPQVQSGLFGAKQPAPAFGTTTLFNNTTSKPSLFGNTTSNNQFTAQPSSVFGGFGATSQPFNAQTVSTSTVAPSIGYSSPAEALLQQQMTQQKILSLVSNRPYGVNKLFLGQSLLSSDRIITSSDSVTNNTNLMSLAIKRNDSDNFGMFSRRNVLHQNTKIPPNNLYKVFSGFDDEDDSSVKSSNIEKHFFTKREDWKYLPPNAFEKARVSINGNNGAIHNNTFLNNSNNAINGNTYINGNNSLANYADYSEILALPHIKGEQTKTKDSKKPYFSTPITAVNREDLSMNYLLSPIHAQNAPSENIVDENFNNKCIGSSSFEQLDTSVVDGANDIDRVKPLNHKDQKKELKEISKLGSCKIKLTKDGYYTAPVQSVLDKLVMQNDDGELECWVENFIIGRNSYGSIRFPGLTNVYGLDFDELVEIRRKEVSVYPDEDNKPDEGEELNKLAQVILQEVWPIDKSTGKTIADEERLATMNFETKLRRVTEKMGARFIRYSAPEGLWIFEVDHFSKYRYDESEEEAEETSTTKVEEYKTVVAPAKDVPNSSVVVCAEADSMTDREIPTMRSGLQRLFDQSNNRSVHRMKQNLYQNDDEDEEDVHSTRLFPTTPSRNLGSNYRQKEEPQAKRFQTMEMGRSMINSSLNNSTMDDYRLVVKDIEMEDTDYENTVTIKPMQAEPLASTEPIVRDCINGMSMKIPNQFRDIRSMKMPYLPLKMDKYFDIDINSINKKYPFDSGLCQGNRFRVGFHMSSNEESQGLKFIRKDNSNHSDINLSSIAVIRHENVQTNSVNIMSLDYNFTEYQEQLMQSALESSICNFNNNEDCPLWTSMVDLGVLKSYVNVQNQQNNSLNAVTNTFGRIVSLCHSLWADIGDNDVQKPIYLKHLERKQSLSKWIRRESRKELMKKVEELLRASPLIDVTKCNDIILESLCCGEINLACKLATKTKQHRMALLISQSAGSLANRVVIREQLQSWIADKSDQNIPANIMSIYVLLAGMTNFTTSDGSVITPMKHLKWYQAFGCYQWFIQPYLDPIKSSVDLYEEDFKTDLDIPAPFRISSSEATLDDYYPYYDCCFHLLKFSCDSLHDLDALLNPPTMSRSLDHKLSLDWSSSWHLSNILASLGRTSPSNNKLSVEWAAQLERAGQWHWAIFALLHITNSKVRKNAVKRILMRHGSATKVLSEREIFVVEKLSVPVAWLHEAKAVHCKNVGCSDLEAYHWLMVGDYDKSHKIYVNDIWPRLLLSDRFEKMKELLGQFTETGAQKHLPGWPHGGGLFLQYLAVMHRIKTLAVANKVMKYAVLTESCHVVPDSIVEQQCHDGDFESQLAELRIQARKLASAMDSYVADSDMKIICKRQMDTVARTFLEASTELY